MKTFTRSARFAGAAILLGAMLNAHSATTQISTEPLITSVTTTVQPNVFLMMDDSGSMAWDYMPDNAGNFGRGTYGAASPQCNGMFYDSIITYTPPVTSAGVSYATSSFTTAWNDGYNTGGGSTNLSTSFVDAGGDSARPAFYYKYTGTQTTERLKDYYNTSSTFYKECNSPVSTATITIGGTAGATTVTSITIGSTTITSGAVSASTSNALASSLASAVTLGGYRATSSGSIVTIEALSPADVGVTPGVVSSGSMTVSKTAFSTTAGSAVFTKVLVSATSGAGSTDERTNFANWWSYYHTRILMMKTATGLAFYPVCPSTSAASCNFRVGFATINNNTGSDLLAVNTFDATQKAAWYAKLYATRSGNSTPLREALADVGRMYAHKLPATNANNALTSSVPDPIQYACQQNFTILTTDGFWNGSTTYKLDGTPVGNQDYFEPRPLYDGSNYSVTTTTPYTTVQQRQSVKTGVVTTVTGHSTLSASGAACTVASVIPAGSTSAPMIDNVTSQIALGLSATNPDPGRCTNLAANAWICVGIGSASPVVSSSTVTDSTGTPWYLVSRTTNLSSSTSSTCVSDRTAFGGAYSRKLGACSGIIGYSGTSVTQTKRTQITTISGVITTTVDNYTANQQTTQSTINGVVGATSALTPATLTYSFTNNVSTISTAPTSTVGPGAWVDGAVTSTCVTAAALPSVLIGWWWDTPMTTTSSTAGTSVVTVLSTVGPTVGTPNVTSSNSAGTFDTLADVAEYYYITDLRTSALGNNLSAAPNISPGTWNGTDISANKVPPSGLDNAAHQHMTTFTLGLGARGKMVYDPKYESETAANGGGDFFDVRQGNTANGSSVCNWQTSGSCNWPTPGSDKVENIDDLWHAAVNGRGTYFSAANPTSLASGLAGALAGVQAHTGAASAATTSNAFVTQNDNFIFRSTYLTGEWSGELLRQQIDIGTGAVLPAIDWSAQAKLDANAARTVYFFDPASTTKLSPFTLANLTTAGLNSYFTLPYIASLSQISCSVLGNCLSNWTPNTSYAVGNEFRNGTTWYHVNTAYTSGATFGMDNAHTTVVSGVEGLNLVAFIKGDRSYEGADTDNINGKYYRQRSHVLGDIVTSESHYVQGAISPFFADPGYTAFKTSVDKTVDSSGVVISGRQPMVYAGANDGMLHAFYASSGLMDSTTGHVVTTGGINVAGGDEAWAFIPTAVIPNLYKLADKEYKNTGYHQYFVDGSPITADVCISNCTTVATAVWKTILVGGLNSGGNNYYALDITNPVHPIALWQFTDANMGLTYGPPKIVKLKPTTTYPGGQWVALLTSGYNNTAGDGQGHLYVVDAYTGALATSVNGTGTISTGVGSVATPSGLVHLDAWLTNPGVDVTAEAVYAGDMLGNLWRFDINGDVGAAGYDAQLLATLSGPTASTNTSPGNIQPISTKPLLSLVGTTRVIYVGTGEYLGVNDQSDKSQQSFYAIKDDLLTTTTPSVAIYGNPRLTSGFIQQTQTSTTCPAGTATNICVANQTVVVSTNNAVSFTTNNGWFFDFPLSPVTDPLIGVTINMSTGERVNVDPAIKDGIIYINTNEPNSSSCSVGGNSFQYQVNYLTGGALGSSTTGVIAMSLGNELASRPVVVTLPDGTTKVYTQGSAGGAPTDTSGWGLGGGTSNTLSGVPSRKSWRELINR